MPPVLLPTETHVTSSPSQSFTGARNLFPSERHDGLRTGALGDDGVEKTELPVTRRLSVRNVR